MKKSSSNSSISLSSDDESGYATINEKWIHSKIHLSKELLICPICYQFSYEPVECETCNRLFCKEDYHTAKEQKDSCPLCKAKPWTIKDSIHISYKSLISEMKFKCDICKKKDFKDTSLQDHLKNQHKLQVKKYQQKLYDYSLQFEDGTVVPFSLNQNLEINYRLKILKIALNNEMEMMSDDGNKIYIDFEDMVFVKEDSTQGKIIKEKSSVIKANQEYPMWIVYLDEGPVFFAQKYQKTLEEGFKDYTKSPYMCEIHLDVTINKQIVRYRIMFQHMFQVNTLTQFKRKITRQKIIFKD